MAYLTMASNGHVHRYLCKNFIFEHISNEKVMQYIYVLLLAFAGIEV